MLIPYSSWEFHKPCGTLVLGTLRERDTATGSLAAHKCSDTAGHWDIASGMRVRCTTLYSLGNHGLDIGKQGKQPHKRARHTPSRKRKCQCQNTVFRIVVAGIQARKLHHNGGCCIAKCTVACSCWAVGHEKQGMTHMMAIPNCQAGNCFQIQCLLRLFQVAIPPAIRLGLDLRQQNPLLSCHRLRFLHQLWLPPRKHACLLALCSQTAEAT